MPWLQGASKQQGDHLCITELALVWKNGKRIERGMCGDGSGWITMDKAKVLRLRRGLGMLSPRDAEPEPESEPES